MWDVKRPPHFLLSFDPSLCSKRLNIPSKFAKHIEGQAPGIVSLVGPSGNAWYGHLVFYGDDLFFDDGWAEFVRDHFLELGDSLVFRYDGDLDFRVQIFDQSMCEKETAFSAQSSQDLSNYSTHVARKRDRESSALLDGFTEGVPKRMRSSQAYSECLTKNQGSSSYVAEEACLQEDLQRSQAPSFINEAENGKSKLDNYVTIAVPCQAVFVNDDSEPPFTTRATMLDMLLSASEAERIARSFTSCFPNFIKVMKRFNISGSYTLNVPYQFAMEHLPKCKVKIVLHNLKGGSWNVNSIPTTKVQTSHTFCGGWLGFVRDNNVDIGDICIFELIRKFEFRVRVLRVRKEGTDSLNGESVHGGKVNVSSSSHKMSGRKSKKVSVNANSSLGSALGSRLSTGGGESEIQKRYSSQDRKGSQTKGFMSIKSAPEEKLAAQSFVSNFPHFVRIMKKFNVSGSYTLKVPYQFSMERLPNCRTEIVLRNLKGKCWTVNSIPTTKVQTLHTFCGGWMAFVRDNDIQMGDICIFELVDKYEMLVHVCGIGKKGLDYQIRSKNNRMV